jgi:flagellar hook-associated protein 2
VATISSAGIGSGLDVKTIVTQLMATEQGQMNALVKRANTDNAKISAFGSIKSALSTLQVAVQALNLSSTFSSMKTSVADSSAYTATLNGTAVAGTYNIEVKALAESQKLVSQSYTDTGTTVGEGTITINVGKYAATGTPPAFTQASGSTAVAIKIDSTNHSLSGIRDAINAANAGVSASIINDGSGARLSLTAANSGTASALKIDVAESGAAGLGKLAYDASAGSGLTQNVAAADAHLVVDGVDVYKPTNTVTDAVQGITLNLLKTTTGTDKLSLTRDTDKVRKAIDDFVSGYNGVHKQLDSLTAYDSATQQGSLLTGDSTAGAIETKLRGMISGFVNTGDLKFGTLSDLGITFQKDGTLSLDTDRRDKILNDPGKDVKKLFVKTSDSVVGLASQLNTGISGMIFGNDALLNQRIDSLKTDVTSLGSKRDAEAVRLQHVQDRYTKQFSSLDTLVASMNKTQQFLTQQLAQLSANSK